MEVDWEKRAIFSLLRRPTKSHFFIVSNAIASFSQPLIPVVMFYKFKGDERMKLRVIIHEAEEGGYWAEVPSIPAVLPKVKHMMNF